MLPQSTALERWLPIPGWESLYEASDAGNIRRILGPRLCKPSLHNGGYLVVWLFGKTKGQGEKYYVHRLVAAAFLGECPDGLHVNHRDGDKQNNRPCNLGYVTPAENNRHAYATGLRRKDRSRPVLPPRRPYRVLTEAQVRQIRAMAVSMGYRRIAKALGINPNTVHNVTRGAAWRQVK